MDELQSVQQSLGRVEGKVDMILDRIASLSGSVTSCDARISAIERRVPPYPGSFVATDGPSAQRWERMSEQAEWVRSFRSGIKGTIMALIPVVGYAIYNAWVGFIHLWAALWSSVKR